LRHLLVSHAVAAAIFVALFVWQIRAITAAYRGESIFERLGAGNLVASLLYPVYDFTIGESLFPWTPFGALGLALWALAFVAVARRPYPAKAFLVPALVVGYGLALGAFLLVLRDLPFTTIASRNMHLVPVLLAATALALTDWRRFGGPVALGIGLVSVVGIGNYYADRQLHTPIYVVPSREVARTLVEEWQPEDLLVAPHDSALWYYLPADLAQLTDPSPSELGAVLAARRPARVWLAILGRDRTQNDLPAQYKRVLAAGYRLAERRGYVEQDPTYRELKSRLLGYSGYRYRLELSRFERIPGV
jgi:hypothetical protein